MDMDMDMDIKKLRNMVEDFIENAACVRVCIPNSIDELGKTQMTVISKAGEEITEDCGGHDAMKIGSALNKWGFVLVEHFDKKTNETELNYLHPDAIDALSLEKDGIINVKFDGIEDIKEIPADYFNSDGIWDLLMHRRSDELEPIGKLEPVAPEPL